jgi:hypothetical protein
LGAATSGVSKPTRKFNGGIMRRLPFLLLLVLAIALVHNAAAQAEKSKIRFPRIVAHKSETVSTATGAIPLTSLVPPDKSGLYRISFYWIQTTSPLCGSNCNGQGELNLIFHWADDAGAQSGNPPVGQTGPFFNSFSDIQFSGQPVPVEAVFVVRVNAGLEYEISPVNPVGDEGATYEYFITVERL